MFKCWRGLCQSRGCSSEEVFWISTMLQCIVPARSLTISITNWQPGTSKEVFVQGCSRASVASKFHGFSLEKWKESEQMTSRQMTDALPSACIKGPRCYVHGASIRHDNHVWLRRGAYILSSLRVSRGRKHQGRVRSCCVFLEASKDLPEVPVLEPSTCNFTCLMFTCILYTQNVFHTILIQQRCKGSRCLGIVWNSSSVVTVSSTY